MAKFARIIDGVVTDFIAPLEGFTIEQCFHPDILAMYTPVDGAVQTGWVVTEDGIVDPNPPEETPVEEAPADTPPTA